MMDIIYWKEMSEVFKKIRTANRLSTWNGLTRVEETYQIETE